MKVLLVSANNETSPYPVYPLGIDYVAGAAGDGHDIYIADANEAGDAASLENRIKAIAPDIIGISIRNIDNTDEKESKSYINHYKSLVLRIREITLAPVVLGGSGYTLFPKQLLEALRADYGIVGEGERFKIFLDAYEKKADVAKLEGVIMPGVSRLEVTPPPWDGEIERRFDPESSYIDYYIKNGGMLNLQTKRGCPFKCIYCTYPHIEGGRLRLMSPRAVADMAIELQEAGAKYLFITDSIFNSDYGHSIEVARWFQKAGLSIPWGAYIAPTRPPADYFRILGEAGMTHVEFGTEAFSDAILKNYRKPFRTEDIFYAHRAAVEAGLNTAHFFLPGAPAETPQTLSETLDNTDRLERTVCFFFVGIRIYPYTRLYEIALASGQITKDQDLLIPHFYCPEGIGLEEVKKTLQNRAQNRLNWVFGAGGQKMAKIISRLHARGHAGPLWEYLIQ
jgi:radical SAM superfamily enzyme YgiQ (UPF0313 family)